jgi:plastocyanin
MPSRRVVRALVGLSALAAAACGGSNSAPQGFFISIRNMTFTPLSLDVPPGATVTVLNDDGIGHSVTSEATANAFTPGGVDVVTFDTGVFTGQRSFTIPSSAQEGTVVPYYCQVHRATMVTPTGTITIRAAALPSAPPSGGSGGGGGMSGY